MNRAALVRPSRELNVAIWLHTESNASFSAAAYCGVADSSLVVVTEFPGDSFSVDAKLASLGRKSHPGGSSSENPRVQGSEANGAARNTKLCRHFWDARPRCVGADDGRLVDAATHCATSTEPAMVGTSGMGSSEIGRAHV